MMGRTVKKFYASKLMKEHAVKLKENYTKTIKFKFHNQNNSQYKISKIKSIRRTQRQVDLDLRP